MCHDGVLLSIPIAPVTEGNVSGSVIPTDPRCSDAAGEAGREREVGRGSAQE
jgi:hypothetical protein